MITTTIFQQRRAMNPESKTTANEEIQVEVLIEDVSIDGMCGVY